MVESLRNAICNLDSEFPSYIIYLVETWFGTLSLTLYTVDLTEVLLS